MENPTSWNDATKLIAKTIEDHDVLMLNNEPEIGYSVYTKIYQALKLAGHIDLKRKAFHAHVYECGQCSRQSGIMGWCEEGFCDVGRKMYDEDL